MTTLTLVRHGETDWNRDRRIQGSTDIPLNDTGRRQAREAAEALRTTLDPDARVLLFASDLSRARETAEVIAGVLGAEAPRLSPDLRERSYGEAEGVDAAAFVARWGDWYTAEVPGAEPWPHLRARAIRALRRVVRESRREAAPTPSAVVVVSHGALIRELIRHATGGEQPPPGERLPNGSMHTFFVERERLRLLSTVTAAA